MDETDNDFPSKKKDKRSKRRRRNYQAKKFLEDSYGGGVFAPKFIPKKKKRERLRPKDLQKLISDEEIE